MRFSLAIVALATTAAAAKPRSCKYSDIADEQVELEGLYQSLDEVESPWERFWINREIKELKAELKKCGVKVDEDQPAGTTSTIGIADKRGLGRRARTYSCKYSDIADEQVELEGLYHDLEDAQKPWEKFWIQYQIKELKAELKKCGVKVDSDQPEGTTTTIGIADKRDLGSRLSRRAKTRSCKYSDIADEQVELEGLYQDLEDAKPWEKYWINWQIKDLKAELKKCGIKVDDDQPEGTTTTIGIADKRDFKHLPKWLTDKYAECVARPHSNPMSSIWLAQAAEIQPSLLGGASVEFKIASRQSIGCGSIDALEDYLFYLFAVYGSKPSPYQLALMQKAFEIIYTCGRDVSKWTTVVPSLTIPGSTVTPSTGTGGSTTITPSTGGSGSTTTISPSTGGSGSGTTITGSGGSTSSGSGTTISGSGGNSGGSGTSITPSGSSGSGTTISGSGSSGSGTTISGSGSGGSGTTISGSGSSGSGTSVSPSTGGGSGTSISGSGSGSNGAVIPSGSSGGSSTGIRVSS